jgi:hypothetical protein
VIRKLARRMMLCYTPAGGDRQPMPAAAPRGRARRHPERERISAAPDRAMGNPRQGTGQARPPSASGSTQLTRCRRGACVPLPSESDSTPILSLCFFFVQSPRSEQSRPTRAMWGVGLAGPGPRATPRHAAHRHPPSPHDTSSWWWHPATYVRRARGSHVRPTVLCVNCRWPPLRRPWPWPPGTSLPPASAFTSPLPLWPPFVVAPDREGNYTRGAPPVFFFPTATGALAWLGL